jgi:hypothetical protein
MLEKKIIKNEMVVNIFFEDIIYPYFIF